MASIMETAGAVRGGAKWRVTKGLLTIWAVQAFWVWAVKGVFLTPDVWASWWFDFISSIIRWVDGSVTQ